MAEGKSSMVVHLSGLYVDVLVRPSGEGLTFCRGIVLLRIGQLGRRGFEYMQLGFLDGSMSPCLICLH